MARGSSTTLPRAYAMMGRMVGHTYVENTLSSLSLAFVVEKGKNQENELVGQPGFLAGRPPFLVFTTKGGRQVVSLAHSWSAAFPQLPWVEFHLSGASCNFLKSIANKGEPGHRDGFPDKATRACMHSLSFGTELRQSISCSLHANLFASLV